MTLFMAVCDVEAGLDEIAHEKLMKNMKPTETVKPLFIGQIFETADLEVMLQATDVDELNEFILDKIRSIKEIREIMVFPITSFRGLAQFGLADLKNSYIPPKGEPVELPLFMVKLDVEPTKDVDVYQKLSEIPMSDDVLPAFLGYTFQQADFDIGFYFFATDTKTAWDFVNGSIRTIDGVWDTEVTIIVHIHPFVSAKELSAILHEQ